MPCLLNKSKTDEVGDYLLNHKTLLNHQIYLSAKKLFFCDKQGAIRTRLQAHRKDIRKEVR